MHHFCHCLHSQVGEYQGEGQDGYGWFLRKQSQNVVLVLLGLRRHRENIDSVLLQTELRVFDSHTPSSFHLNGGLHDSALRGTVALQCTNSTNSNEYIDKLMCRMKRSKA